MKQACFELVSKGQRRLQKAVGDPDGFSLAEASNPAIDAM